MVKILQLNSYFNGFIITVFSTEPSYNRKLNAYLKQADAEDLYF